MRIILIYTACTIHRYHASDTHRVCHSLMRIRSHLRHTSCAMHAHTRAREASTSKQHPCHAALQHQFIRVNPMPLKRVRTAYKAFSPLALCHPFKKILMRSCAFSRVNPNGAGTGFAYAPSLRQRMRPRLHAHAYARTQARKTLCFTRVY
jgi:hypothetical protein